MNKNITVFIDYYDYNIKLHIFSPGNSCVHSQHLPNIYMFSLQSLWELSSHNSCSSPPPV